MKYPAVQPVLWLLLFGEVMAQVRGVSPGNLPTYLDFLSASILAQSVLFVAIFYDISAIWEHDLGVLQRYLISPPPPFCAGSRQSLWRVFGRWRAFAGSRPGHRGTTLQSAIRSSTISASKAGLRAAASMSSCVMAL